MKQRFVFLVVFLLLFSVFLPVLSASATYNLREVDPDDQNGFPPGDNDWNGGNQAQPCRDYIIPDSNTRQLTTRELWQWDYETLGYILNEIFARYGYVFKAGGDYEEYFLQRSWYTPNASSDNQKYVYDKLTSLEWNNERLVKDVRQAMRDTNNYNTNGMNWRDVICQ